MAERGLARARMHAGAGADSARSCTDPCLVWGACRRAYVHMFFWVCLGRLREIAKFELLHWADREQAQVDCACMGAHRGA